MSVIQVRTDTAANWASVNPTLAAGETGFDVTFDRSKRGDGIRSWSELPWSNMPRNRTPNSIPDLYKTEFEINPAGYAVSVSSASSATTSIASGITAADMAAAAPNALMDGKVGLIGCKRSHLYAVAAGYYGPSWRQDTSGVYNHSSGAPSTPWGIRFFSYNTRYVEILGGLGAVGEIKTFIDGRQFTLEPESPTWTNGSANNKYKLDFGAGNAGRPHEIEMWFHWSWSLAKIFTEAGGYVHKALPVGAKWGYLSDSLGDIDTLYTGDHLAMYFPRLMRSLGVQDFYLDSVGGTGFGVTTGSYSKYTTRMTNNAAVYDDLDWLVAGTWFNDKSQGRTAVQIAGDVTTTITNAAGFAKKPRLIILGVYDPNGVNGTGYTDIDATCITACAGSAAYISMAQGKVYGFSGNLLLNNGPLITTVNRTTAIGGDNIHPTLLGHKLLFMFMREAIKAIIEEVS